MSGGANPAMASNASLSPNTLQVRKKLSNQSIKSVKKSPSMLSLNVNHSKAATAPADSGSDSVIKSELVESPTDIKFPSPSSAPAATPEKPNGSSMVNLTVQRQNTDSGVNSGKSSRSWRRSTTRKPTGLASAIAASGLAMANPVLSPSHSAQITPPVVSPQHSISSAASKKSMTLSGSPPYMSVSPAQSSTSQQHLKNRSVELSPKRLKPKRSTNGTTGSSKPRKSSVSVNSDNGSEYHGDEVRPEYYSGLDDYSEDESGSDLDSDLDLGDDDIPVTGFAVASNKRNADFHELFPTIPEGDYLIEGRWLFSFFLH